MVNNVNPYASSLSAYGTNQHGKKTIARNNAPEQEQASTNPAVKNDISAESLTSSQELKLYGENGTLKLDGAIFNQEARDQRKADFAQSLSRSVTIDPLNNEFQILGVKGIFNDGTLEKHISDSLEGKVKNASLVADELGKMIRGTISNPDASVEERAANRETALKHASYIAENYFDDPDEAKAFLDGINKFAENDIMREKGYIVLDNSDFAPFKSYESPVNSYGGVSWETYAKKAGFSSASEVFADKGTLNKFYTSLHDNSKVWDEELTKSFEENENKVTDIINLIKGSLNEDDVASSLQRLMKAF